MIHFTTLLALVVGCMEVVQPAAAKVLAGLTARIDLGPVDIAAFHRRQTTGGIPQVPPQCASICDPINSIIASNTCPPSQCCLASFETTYFNCFVCVANSVTLTDYSVPQSIIDKLYNECASLGFRLPVLTFPGQPANRPLSSVVQSLLSSRTIASSPTPTIVQSTIGPLTSSISTTNVPQVTITAVTPTPTSTGLLLPSFGIRSMETNCFNLIGSAMILGTWFYFAMY